MSSNAAFGWELGMNPQMHMDAASPSPSIKWLYSGGEVKMVTPRFRERKTHTLRLGTVGPTFIFTPINRKSYINIAWKANYRAHGRDTVHTTNTILFDKQSVFLLKKIIIPPKARKAQS